MSNNQTHKKPTLTFTLVHGTFARNADWVVNDDDKNMFRRKLRDKLKKDYEVCFDVVCWGYDGCFRRLMDNTNARRFFGISKLKQHLLNCDDATAKNRRYIVAHSHGGNIAMCTLNQPEQRELLKKVTGVICLSSPFLEYKRSAFDRALLVMSVIALLFKAYAIQGWAIWTYALFYLAVAATIIATRNFGDTKESFDKISERLEKVKLVSQEHFAEQPGRPSFPAIRPHRDEVTILFWITRSLGVAFRWLWGVLNQIGAYLIVIIVLMIFINFAVEKLSFAVDTGGLQSLLQSFMSLMSLADQFAGRTLLLIVTVVLSVMVVVRWSYAFDSLTWIAGMDVESKIVPWEGAKKIVMDTFGLVKHTRIQNQSPSAIADWIRQEEAVAFYLSNRHEEAKGAFKGLANPSCRALAFWAANQSCLADASETEPARKALMRVDPEFRVTDFLKSDPLFTDQSVSERVARDLTAASLPN